MKKQLELTDPNSCMSKAKQNEMTFVLLGRDAAAPVAIRAWVAERIRLGKNTEADPQIVEALACASAMEVVGPSVPKDDKPRMFYFGPWSQSGHYFYGEGGYSADEARIPGFPFGHYGGKILVDGHLQPGCPKSDDRLQRNSHGYDVEGLALLHHIQGWTALCFWDRSVDHRGACNSNYFAEGIYTFGEMVTMAKERFAYRWNKMNFEVRLAE